MYICVHRCCQGSTLSLADMLHLQWSKFHSSVPPDYRVELGSKVDIASFLYLYWLWNQDKLSHLGEHSSKMLLYHTIYELNSNSKVIRLLCLLRTHFQEEESLLRHIFEYNHSADSICCQESTFHQHRSQLYYQHTLEKASVQDKGLAFFLERRKQWNNH